MKIVIGSDHAGFEYKTKLIDFLTKKGFDIIDIGTNSTESVDYPDIAKKLANSQFDKGILICGTGVGMSIASNRFSNIRASLAVDKKTVTLARLHNDANVLCIGARTNSFCKVKRLVNIFLNVQFSNSPRHIARIKKI